MLAKPTLNELLKEELERAQASYAPISHGVRHDLLGVLARIRAACRHETAENLAFLARQLFPDTAESEYLREHWRDRVTPLDASFAVGEAQVRGTEGVPIPAGTLWRSEGGENYLSVKALRIGASGTALLYVEAQRAGSRGNLAEGKKLSLSSSRIAGLETEALSRGIGGGVDTEDDTTYRQRIIAWERQGIKIGRSGDWAAWAVDSNAEVDKAWEFANHDASGALLIQVISGNQLEGVRQVSNIKAVKDYLAQVAPLALTEVQTPEIVAVDIMIKLALKEDTVDVRANIVQRLKEYWEMEARPGSQVTESQLRTVVEDGKKVTRAEVMLSSNPLSFSKFELPTHGEVTWT